MAACLIEIHLRRSTGYWDRHRQCRWKSDTEASLW